jgi:hypothetical protein
MDDRPGAAHLCRAPLPVEVPMVAAEVARQMGGRWRSCAGMPSGSRESWASRNTVRRYLVERGQRCKNTRGEAARRAASLRRRGRGQCCGGGAAARPSVLGVCPALEARKWAGPSLEERAHRIAANAAAGLVTSKASPAFWAWSRPRPGREPRGSHPGEVLCKRRARGERGQAVRKCHPSL